MLPSLENFFGAHVHDVYLKVYKALGMYGRWRNHRGRGRNGAFKCDFLTVGGCLKAEAVFI